MIHILMMANDSLLAESLASILAEETDLDVVRLTHRELGKGDQYSAVIIIDEDESENTSIKASDLFWNHNTYLVIMISLKSRDIYVYERYQLVNPEMEQMIHIVREFSRMNLKKKVEDVNMKVLRKMTVIPLFASICGPIGAQPLESVLKFNYRWLGLPHLPDLLSKSRAVPGNPSPKTEIVLKTCQIWQSGKAGKRFFKHSLSPWYYMGPNKVPNSFARTVRILVRE